MKLGETFGAAPWQIEEQWTSEQIILMYDALLDRKEIFDEEPETGSGAQNGKKAERVGEAEIIDFMRM